MAFCGKCGAQMADGTAFCPKCGAAQSATQTAAPGAPPAAGTQSGLSENAAAVLSYLVGWITGLIFFLIDKRPYVRYHAAQSIVVFGGLHIILIVLGMAFGMGFFFHGFGGLGGFGFGFLVYELVNLLALILWIFCMVKAGQGSRFRIPIAADLAESLAGKSI